MLVRKALLSLFLSLTVGVVGRTAQQSRPSAVKLHNRGLSVEIDPSTGALTRITNRLTAETYQLQSLAFEAETSLGPVRAGKARGFRSVPEGVEFTQDGGPVQLLLTYRLPWGQDFLEKTVAVRNSGPTRLVLHEVVLEQIKPTDAGVPTGSLHRGTS